MYSLGMGQFKCHRYIIQFTKLHSPNINIINMFPACYVIYSSWLFNQLKHYNRFCQTKCGPQCLKIICHLLVKLSNTICTKILINRLKPILLPRALQIYTKRPILLTFYRFGYLELLAQESL